MFGDLMKGLMGGADAIVKEKISTAMADVSKELDKKFNEFFIVLKPINDEFEFRCDIYHYVDGKPVHAREITIAEIVGKE